MLCLCSSFDPSSSVIRNPRCSATRSSLADRDHTEEGRACKLLKGGPLSNGRQVRLLTHCFYLRIRLHNDSEASTFRFILLQFARSSCPPFRKFWVAQSLTNQLITCHAIKAENGNTRNTTQSILLPYACMYS